MPISKIFACGSNASGQLGIGSLEDYAIPQRCIFAAGPLQSLSLNDKVIKIVAGGSHTLVQLESGAVFAAGNNQDGQCGLPKNITQTSRFHRVVLEGEEGRSIEIFSNIAATWTASFLVENGDKIHVLGAGSKGELGLGEGITTAPYKAIIKLSELADQGSKVVSISGGMNHVAMLTAEGEAIGCGASRKGQLGQTAKEQRSFWTPTCIKLPTRMNRVVTGRDFTFFSDDAGVGFLLGTGKHLQTHDALGQSENLQAGWSNIYALSRTRLKALGRNDRGQLPPPSLPDLKMLSAGSEHCIGLTTAGDAIAWGWGEHGNCGESIDANGNVAGRWNCLSLPLEDDEIVNFVAAGCATSFLVVDSKF